MSAAPEIVEAPFSSRRGFFGGLTALALFLGALVVVDALPRLNPPPPEVEGKKFVPQDLGPMGAIEIVRGRKDFRLEDTSGAWELIDAAGQEKIGNERVEDFLSEIGKLVEVADIGHSSDVSLEEFGLRDPKERIILFPKDGPEIQILLGDRNPPLTGIYALVLPGEHVVLVGAVLLLEMDKLAALASSQAP